MRFRVKACCLLLAIEMITWPASLRSQTSADLPVVQLNAENAGPRVLEPLTKDSIARNYSEAWRSMAVAMNSNRTDLLDSSFIGFAKDKLEVMIAEQRETGIRTRYLDRGHKADIIFYSPEGLSVELLDTARYELQVLDGERVVHTEEVTARYVVVMTPTEVRWKVRVLQEAPLSSMSSRLRGSQPITNGNRE